MEESRSQVAKKRITWSVLIPVTAKTARDCRMICTSAFSVRLREGSPTPDARCRPCWFEVLACKTLESGLNGGVAVTIKRDKIRRRDWAREVETLRLLNIRGAERGNLLFRFHAFGDHDKPRRFQ